MSPNSRRTASLSLILEKPEVANTTQGHFWRFQVTIKEVIKTTMNNRIMAMLCALVSVMFLSIVPVKAEAAETWGCRFGNHDTVLVAEKESTCTETGNMEHYKCRNCGKLFTDVWGEKEVKESLVTTPMKAHTLEHHEEISATCVDTGMKEYWQCTVCEQKFTDAQGKNVVKDENDLVLPAKGHNADIPWSHDDEEHYHECLNCGEKLDIAKHDLEYIDNSDGTHKAECTICGRDPESLLAQDHVDDDNDCVCDLCGAALAHSPVRYNEPATCETDGVKWHYECEVCHQLFWNEACTEPTTKEAVKISATGHNWKGMYCDEETHWKQCENCGEHKEEAEHNFVWSEDADGKTHSAKCEVCWKAPAEMQKVAHDYEVSPSENGVTHKLTCKVCEKVTYQTCTAKNGECVCEKCGVAMKHDLTKLEKVAAKPATCMGSGWEEHYKCNNCNKLFNSEGLEIELPVLEKVDHKWWDKGLDYGGNNHVQMCEYCKVVKNTPHTDSDGDCLCDINDCGKLVHEHKVEHVAEVKATCKDEGHQEYWVLSPCGRMFADEACTIELETVKVYPVTEDHVWGDWTSEGSQHIRTCTVCGKEESGKHLYEKGSIICDICKIEVGLRHKDAKAATCTESGNVEYWYSTVTGKKYADEDGNVELENVIIPATKHNLTGWVDNGDGRTHTASCQNEGCDHVEREYHDTSKGCYCADCNGNLYGHKLTLVAMKEATCEEAGHKAYFECSCGKLYDMNYEPIEEPVAIAKLGHSTDGTVKKDAKEGKHYTECTACGKKFYEEHVMVVQDPLKGNYHQYVCRCGELKVEKHYDKDGDGVCDACDHAMSSSTVTVEQHDNVTVRTGNASTTNKNYTWWRNWLEALIPGNAGGATASAPKAETSQQQGTATTETKAQTPANSASQNSTQNSQTSQNTTASTNSGETVTVNTNVLAQFFNWFLSLFQ